MHSVQECQNDSKRRIIVTILNRVLVLIENLWSYRTDDHLLVDRLRNAHRSLGLLRDELDARQTARLA